MDITKWKSVAVRIGDYKILKALSHKKYRAPASMISKLVNDYVGYQAKKQNVSREEYIQRIFEDAKSN